MPHFTHKQPQTQNAGKQGSARAVSQTAQGPVLQVNQSALQRAQQAPHALTSRDLLALQGTVGNHATLNLISSARDKGSEKNAQTESAQRSSLAVAPLIQRRSTSGVVVQRVVDTEIAKMQQIQAGSNYFGKKDRKITKLLQAYNKHMRSGAAPTPENAEQLDVAIKLIGKLIITSDKKKLADPNWVQRERLLNDIRFRLVKERQELNSYREVKNAKRLGSGSIATVWQTKFDDDFEAVFKEDEARIENPHSPTVGTGMSHEDPNLGSRAIAMHRLDQLLGTGVIPRTERAMLGNRAGTAMEMVKGKQLSNSKKIEGVDQYSSKFLDMDMSNSVFQRGMSNLQVLDMISGQIDRHGGNVFVVQDENGNITGVRGIDNDFAFGQDLDGKRVHGFDRGLPEYIDYNVAMNILNITDRQIRETLVGLLTDGEIAKTIERFHTARDFVQSLIVFENMLNTGQQTGPAPKGKLVRTWNKETYEGQIARGRERVVAEYNTIKGNELHDPEKAYERTFSKMQSGSYLHDRVMSLKHAKEKIESGDTNTSVVSM